MCLCVCVCVCVLQCWEFGIPLCRELAFQYESLYDYQSLSWIRVSCCTTRTVSVTSVTHKPQTTKVPLFLFYCKKPFVCVCRKWRQLIMTTLWSSSVWSRSSSGSDSTAGSSPSSSEWVQTLSLRFVVKYLLFLTNKRVSLYSTGYIV